MALCAPERIDKADHLHVFLQGRVDDHLGRLPQAGVDHFHAGVAQRPRDHLGAAVVAVQARLGHQHSNRVCMAWSTEVRGFLVRAEHRRAARRRFRPAWRRRAPRPAGAAWCFRCPRPRAPAHPASCAPAVIAPPRSAASFSSWRRAGRFVDLQQLDGLVLRLEPVDPHDGALAGFHFALVAVAGGGDLASAESRPRWPRSSRPSRRSAGCTRWPPPRFRASASPRNSCRPADRPSPATPLS